MGKRHSPSFPWKEVPRRGGGWNRRGMKGNMRKVFSRIVIPSGAEGSFSFVIFCFMRESVCMKHRSSDSQGARCFPLSAAPHPLPCRERKRFLAFARNDECGEAVFSYHCFLHEESVEAAFSFLPSFSWKEVPRRGGGWNRRDMKGNMRKAVSRIVIPSGAEGSFSS